MAKYPSKSLYLPKTREFRAMSLRGFGALSSTLASDKTCVLVVFNHSVTRVQQTYICYINNY